MKRLFQCCLAPALLFAASGCVDLEEKLVSSVGASYVETPQGLTDATNAMYAALRGFYGRGETDYALTELGTDIWTAADQVSSGGAQNWIYYDTYEATYTSEGAFLDAFWSWGYTLINQANTVLEYGARIPVGGTLTPEVKNSRLGEAHFIRALAYFELVQQFGGLTINLNVPETLSTEATRESEDSVYKVIISDLERAIELLPPEQPDYGRATSWAAKNLLAKVYLTRAYREWNTANRQADFQRALELAQDVIRNGPYALVPDYASLWCGEHRAEVPPDPGGQSFCDLTNYSERNSEFIFVVQYSYDPTQYTLSNYDHLEFLSRYDGDPAWAAGLIRDLDNGRPFRRLRPTPALLYFFDQTRYVGTPGPGADILDTRFDASFQTVWFANQNGANPVGTCPKCTSGQPIRGILLRDASGAPVGAAAGSDTALVYVSYPVSDEYRLSKPYRIATWAPCTVDPTQDCGKDNDARGVIGYMHYPSLKKWQDNLRRDYFSQDGGKDFPVMRLGETYLIAAEAAVGLGQLQVAADMVNVLRVRAACAGPPKCKQSQKNNPAILVNASEMTLDFIMDERARELAGEYNRWKDLRRPGKEFFLERIRKYNPYARPNIQDKHYYRPIPQRQINGVTGTPYPQNPGW
ncbi:MAG TPA: RagB/SusD family nutrient uptake outer membrane protein [Longimicrobiales bacterium]